MKRTRTIVVALICGIACAACVFLYLQDAGAKADAARAEALARYGGDQLEVCVAKRDIAAGETLDEGVLEKRLWVADLLPENPITQTADAVGKQATSTILKGEVLTARRFDDALSAIEVPNELVAVSVSARDVQTIGGALRPGMLVDVYATGAGQASANLVAHGVLVLATNASAQAKSSSDSVSWVTLALEPESVQEVVAIAQTSQMYFTLPGDDVPDPDVSAKPTSQGAVSADSAAKEDVSPGATALQGEKAAVPSSPSDAAGGAETGRDQAVSQQIQASERG